MRISQRNVRAHRSLCPSFSLGLSLTLSICLPLSFPIIFVDFFGMQCTFIRSLSVYLLFFIHSERCWDSLFCCSSFNNILQLLFYFFTQILQQQQQQQQQYVFCFVTKHIQTSRSKMQNFLVTETIIIVISVVVVVGLLLLFPGHVQIQLQR